MEKAFVERKWYFLKLLVYLKGNLYRFHSESFEMDPIRMKSKSNLGLSGFWRDIIRCNKKTIELDFEKEGLTKS